MDTKTENLLLAVKWAEIAQNCLALRMTGSVMAAVKLADFYLKRTT